MEIVLAVADWVQVDAVLDTELQHLSAKAWEYYAE